MESCPAPVAFKHCATNANSMQSSFHSIGRHELFENQYRAVQVYNCKVDPYQSLLFVNNKYKKSI